MAANIFTIYFPIIYIDMYAQLQCPTKLIIYVAGGESEH